MVRDLLTTLKENPRYLALLATLTVQALEQSGYVVELALVETFLDFLTAMAIGVVAQKSKEGKLL